MTIKQKRLDKSSIRYDSPFFEWKGETLSGLECDNSSGKTTTFAFQNVHGLQLNQAHMSDKLHEIVDNMITQGIQVLGLSEHNISLANHHWRQTLHDTIHRTRPGRITHHFNSGSELDVNGKLMGGTGLLIIDDMTGRLEPRATEGDAMGRWSIAHFRRQQLPPITTISIYQVCQNPTNLIGNTSWHQQRRYLDLHNRTEHPRQAM
jgi:hypothetical protein